MNSLTLLFFFLYFNLWSDTNISWNNLDAITKNHLCWQTLTYYNRPRCHFLVVLWQGLCRRWQELLWQACCRKLWHVSMVVVQKGVTSIDKTVYTVSWDNMSAQCVIFPLGHGLCEWDAKTANVPVKASPMLGEKTEGDRKLWMNC